MLANLLTFTHNSRNAAHRGTHVCDPVQEFPALPDAGDGAVGFNVACSKPGLYPRTAASLQRRCFQALQRRYSGCRSRHGLHGQEQIPAYAGVSGLLYRARYLAGRRTASQHQAGKFAKGRAQAKEPGRRLSTTGLQDLEHELPSQPMPGLQAGRRGHPSGC